MKTARAKYAALQELLSKRKPDRLFLSAWSERKFNKRLDAAFLQSSRLLREAEAQLETPRFGSLRAAPTDLSDQA